MLVDPAILHYTKLSSLIPAAIAHPSMAPTPPVIPDLPNYQEIGHSGLISLWVVFGIMLLSTLAFSSMAWLVPVEKRVFHITMTLITAFAAISYFGMATGGGASFVHLLAFKCHKHDPSHPLNVFRQVFWARYVEWSLTTPLLLLNLALLAGLNGADIIVAVVADVVMVLNGLFHALGQTRVQRWGFYTFSWLAYLVVIYPFVVRGRRNAASRDAGTVRLYGAIGGFILILWTIYPIIWALGVGTLKLSVDSEIIWYAVLDVLAKPIFGLWLLYTHARSSTAPTIEGFWSHGLNNEGTLRLDEDA
ncbi:hypothetical protein V493_01521 [Pseudogymnoascus sp. VKM F-4281 (FW-2241)]|nr:hypothetical protein V493_01521 [Pseudogymnoascus sp. VKM F-4281 (FW-2241)]